MQLNFGWNLGVLIQASHRCLCAKRSESRSTGSRIFQSPDARTEWNAKEFHRVQARARSSQERIGET